MSAIMELPATKRCTKCGEVKSVRDFYKGNAPDGLRQNCKLCINAQNARNYQSNKIAYLERGAKWKRTNNQRVKELAKIRRDSNPDKHKQYVAKWRAENRERSREIQRSYRLRNLDKERERARVNRSNIHSDIKRASSKRYYDNNRDACVMRAREARARKKAMREFFKMHRAMQAIAETLLVKQETF